MTPLSPARKAAEEFASVVDGARGDVADRYADLLTCVDVLRTQETPAPRPDFVANLRERLMDAADTLLVPAEGAPAPTNVVAFPDVARRRQRRLSIAAAAFIVVGGTASVAAAAENSLPGDPLYPIKRGIESAQVSFNSSDSGKGQDLLRQASTRLSEVDGLIDGDGSTDQIESTLSSFQRSATDGADLIFVSYQRNGDPQEITRLRTILGSQLTQLDKLSDVAPGDVTNAFEDARSLVTELDQQARVLCGACGPDTPAGFLPLSSAPALSQLLALPASDVKAATDADVQQSLVDKANEIAGETPLIPPVTEQPDGSTATPQDPARPTLPSIPGLPRPTGTPVRDAVTGLTNGVGELLESLTQPLTETLGNTLTTVTKGLVGGE